MTGIGAYDAKTHWPRLLKQVEAGQSVTITRNGLLMAQRRGRYTAAQRMAFVEELLRRNLPLATQDKAMKSAAAKAGVAILRRRRRPEGRDAPFS